ncbi:MAG: STAS domain-containing protein [Bryobacteraceae bacterium]
MPLTMDSSTQGNTARLKLVGEVDGTTASIMRAEVDKLLTSAPRILVLDVEQLTFMSSAGLRVLIFAKQKQPALNIYVLKPQPPIVDTLRKTGFYDGVYVTDTEPETGTTTA